jgi:hypothetical protein
MRAILIFLELLLLAGCSSTQYVATAKPFSRAVKTVCIDKADQLTEATASQIEANNLALSKIYQRPACKPGK